MLDAGHTPPNSPDSPNSPEFLLKLRPAAWHELRKMTRTESDQALADVLQLNRSTVYRVTTGDAEPSSKFIAHTLAAFRFASFDRLFEWATR